MALKTLLLSLIFFYSFQSQAHWIAEFRLGIQLGAQTEKETNLLYGAHAGILFAKQWNDFSLGMEFRYMNQNIHFKENESHDRLHTFPIGFVARYDLTQLKIRPEIAYFYDCSAYRDIQLFPISYGIAYGAYVGAWRAGLSYLAENQQTFGLFYERQIYRQWKIPHPQPHTGDTIPHKVWDFWSFSPGKIFSF